MSREKTSIIVKVLDLSSIEEKVRVHFSSVINSPRCVKVVDVHFMNENGLEHFIKHFGPIVCPLGSLKELKVIEIKNLADFILSGEKRDKNYRVWKTILEGSPSPLFD